MRKIFIILIIFLFSFPVLAADKNDKQTAPAKTKKETVNQKNGKKATPDKNNAKKSSEKTKKTTTPEKTDAEKATDKVRKEFVFEDVFPKSGELPGGASAWISSDITKSSGNRYVLYEKNYTYYSTQKQMLLGMERNNTYSVSARIFACENTNIALSKYDNLTDVDKKIKGKKNISPAPFGERGVLMALPTRGMGADFYLTFLFRTFVVQVYSDDGFAQIDMASDLEKRLAAYLKINGIDFYMNKINLEVSFDNVTFADRVNFSGDNVSVVALDGTVFDADNKPLAGAKITARETGQTAITDKNGKYSMEISSGWGKAIYLSKMIFIPASAGSGGPFKSGVYSLKVKHALRTVIDGSIDLFASGGRVVGKFLDKETNETSGVSGSIQGDTLLFAVSCPGASSGRLVFKGNIASTGIVKGEVSGCGKSGKWELDSGSLSIFKETKYLRDAGISVQNIVDSGNRKDKDFKAVKLNFTPDSVLNPFYFKKGEIALKMGDIKTEGESALILCEIDSLGKEGEIFCRKPQTVARFSGSQKGGVINIDVSSCLRNPAENGYLLSLRNSKGDSVDFNADIDNSMAELYYYKDDSMAKSLPVIEGSLKTLAGSDIVSNAGKIKPDGEKDIVITLSLSLAGRNLQSLEITGSDGNIARRWNTNPFDIYPVLALIKGEEILNAEDGSINVNLEKETETFDIHIYKGSFGEGGKGSFKIKCVIDGKTYESEEINF